MAGKQVSWNEVKPAQKNKFSFYFLNFLLLSFFVSLFEIINSRFVLLKLVPGSKD
jgi:hypothetical protein